ncbi:Threonine efflux protein (plasmid) [Roseobacter fucihabitans]|uniref:Threonine efflux protein n=2 Tax=Roseobacter fucihabitans TaxID=1537242 RepID=A0ABZ2BZZ5_9RHOB|nr:Threonine efflux protein [Roseobacter litoralis]
MLDPADPFEVVILALASVVVTLAMPGPSLAAVASAALNRGRLAALHVAAGISAGVFMWTILVACGFGVLLQTAPVLLGTMKVLGGSYFLWLTLKSLRAVLRQEQVAFDHFHHGAKAWVCFRHGALVVLTNPAAALMWAAIATFLFGSGLTAWQVAGLSPVFSIAAFMVYGFYGILFSMRAAVAANQRIWCVTEVVFAGVFGVIGVSLILSGISDMKGL